MERRELNVEFRNQSGKGAARKARVIGRIPGVFYGPHVGKPISLSVDSKDLTKVLTTTPNALFTLNAGNNEDLNGRMALIRESQVHPVTGEYIHVDFYEVRMDEEINLEVPIVLVGKAKGVAEGGILDQVRRKIEVYCLPTNIPDKIEVDVTALEINDSIHINEVTLPEGVKIDTDVNFTVAAVVPPAKEEEAPAPAVEGVVEPELVGADSEKKAAKEKEEGEAEAAPKKKEG